MEKIEQVARALAVSDGFHPDAVSNDEDSTPAWRLYITQARAAIEAMREPAVEMIDAFWRQKNCGTQEIGGKSEDTSDYAAYRAMIDAALKEGAE